MTYKAFIAECQKRQRAYIRDEKRRMVKASKLWARYANAMGALGLHPLDRMEIADRQRQLETMAARVDETHGDSPAMVAAWEMHRDRESVA